jgi:hypothetical protein
MSAFPIKRHSQKDNGSRTAINPMKRLFGIGADKAPQKSLDEVSEQMDARSGHLDTKVKAIDHELLELKKQMAVTKGPGLQRLKQRAMMLLKQRKVLDSQYEHPHSYS